MAKTFCVSITNCRKDTDKVTVGFVVANAALGSELDTVVFLSTDGVWAAVKGEAEKTPALQKIRRSCGGVNRSQRLQ